MTNRERASYYVQLHKKQLPTFLPQPQRNERRSMSKALLKSTGVVSGMTLISRILGFVRDIVYAQAFGAGAGTDAFFVAFRIPNLLRRLFAEGGFSLAFVPVFSEYKTQRSHEQMQELVNDVAGTLGIILFLVTALGIVASPLLIWLFAPGFTADPNKFDLTVTMLRITFPYLLFISLTAFAGGILNSWGRFGIPALTPALLNIWMIVAALWIAPHLDRPVIGLAWGVFLAGLNQLLFQIPYLKSLRLLPRPRWNWRSESVQRILRLMLPTLFGSSVAQINLLINTVLASFLVTGSVSWLYYTDRLVEFPLGMFGVTLGVVILPSLAQKHAAASTEEFSHTLDWALRWTLLIGVPATASLMILSGPLVSALFQHGEFNAYDVRMTSRSLITYSLGLLAFMLIKVLGPGFYARQDSRTPVRIGVMAMAMNMVFNVLLVFPLAHAGLALANSLSAYLNASSLFRHLYRQQIYRPSPGWARFLLQILFATGVMGLFLGYGAGDLSAWVHARSGERLLHLTWLVLGGTLIYVLGIIVAGIRPRHLMAAPVAGVKTQPASL
jgi:putative peptidoglycan lipid II flippase